MSVRGSTGLLCELEVKGAASATSAGLQRPVNEDAVLLRSWPDESGAILAVVVDGMGSYGGGDIAASIAIEAFAELLERPPPSSRSERCEALLGAFYNADARIREAGSTSCPEMGATAVAAIVDHRELLHLYAGDCRLYLVRDGAMIYRTRDHSAVQVLVDSGRISAREARRHSMRNLVTSCLGGPKLLSRLTIDPAIGGDCDADIDWTGGPHRKLREGDRIVLCSDGLWGEINDADLLDSIGITSQGKQPEQIVQNCMALATEAGAADNLSVIVIEAEGSAAGAVTAPMEPA